MIDKRRLKFVIPTMAIVAIGAIFMLVNYYEEVPTKHKVLLVFSATLMSGIFAHGLFPNKEDKMPDPKPVETKEKSSK